MLLLRDVERVLLSLFLLLRTRLCIFFLNGIGITVFIPPVVVTVVYSIDNIFLLCDCLKVQF